MKRMSEWAGGARRVAALMGWVLLGAGCAPQQDGAQGPAASPVAVTSRGPVEVRTALVRLSPRQKPEEVRYAVVDGQAVMEGDIILGTVEQVERESERLRAQADGKVTAQDLFTSVSGEYWPNGIVNYAWDQNFPDTLRIQDAIKHIQQRTGLRFQKVAVGSGGNYIRFVRGFRGACFSPVGMQGGEQWLELDDACGWPEVVHELGHSVGLYHEQGRADRDDYVDILWDNVQETYKYAFDKHTTDVTTKGPYDYLSIMHYDSWSFAIDTSKPTMVKKDGSSIFRNRALSIGDVSAIAQVYPGEVRGNVDEVTAQGVLRGWTYDTDRPDLSLAVHVYVDGPSNSGAPVFTGVANVSRPDVNSYYGGIMGVHGFELPIPARFRDGRQHTLYVYGIDAQGRYNPLLPGSPRTFTLRGADGRVESLSEAGVLSGWAMDYDSPNTSITVDCYIDGSFIVSQKASLYRYASSGSSDGVGYHGFSIRIPERYFDGLQHSVVVAAIDLDGFDNPALPGPTSFVLSAPTFQLAGDFVGRGSTQMLSLYGGGYGNRVAVRDYRDNEAMPTLRYLEKWGDSSLLDGWHGAGDIQLAGDFKGLGYDQVLFINTQPGGGRVMIADFRDGVVPAEVRYWENWGDSGMLDGWHDSGDVQLAGDFLGLGYDQVMFINRSGSDGRAQVVSYRGSVPEILYRESWWDGGGYWANGSARLRVGDFLGLGHDQVLSLPRVDGTEVRIVDFASRAVPAPEVYRELGSDNGFIAPFGDTTDKQVAGDFSGRGYDQLLLINNAGTGPRFAVADFRDGVAPAAANYWENWGDSQYILDNMHRDFDGVWAGDFKGLGYKQGLFARQASLGGALAVKVASFRDGVAPVEILFNQVVMQ